MEIAGFLIAPGAWPPDRGSEQAIGFIDLDRWPVDAEFGALPAFPVIGIGDARHPLAQQLDAMVEPPVSAQALASGVLGAPNAAAAIVGLLRSIQGVGTAAALTLESFCFAMLQGSGEHLDWRARQATAVAQPCGDLIINRNGDVLLLMLDRPWADNAIDSYLRDRLYEAFTLAALDTDIQRVELRGRGKAFCVGADLTEFGTTRDPASAHRIRAATLPATVIAPVADRLAVHIQGACVGSGLEMAAFAGRLTASRGAWFQLPELGMGILPGAGGCVSVPRRIGRQRAALMMLSGRRIDARTALRWGLIDAIVDDPPGDDGGPDQIDG